MDSKRSLIIHLNYSQIQVPSLEDSDLLSSFAGQQQRDNDTIIENELGIVSAVNTDV